MIEKIILDYLVESDVLSNKVFLEAPSNPPEEYLIIEKTGSGRSDCINSATVAIKSVSKKSLYNACYINEQVKAVMLEMPEIKGVYSVKLNTDYVFNNTQTKEYRYQAVFQISY